MIRSEDFEVEIGQSELGVFVRVKHKPTGNERIADPVESTKIGKMRDGFVAELKGLLYSDADIRIDVGSTSGGDFIRVVHIPTGVERWALRRDRTQEELLDEVLTEVVLGE